MTTVGKLWSQTTSVINDRVHARWLVEAAVSADRIETVLNEAVTERMVAHLDRMVARYRLGEPIQYVTGRWAFRHIELAIDPRVLIPRPETEELAGLAIEFARRFEPRRVLDLGTGSGAIGLAVADELPLTGTEVWITDADPNALEVARANLAGLGRAAKNVRAALGSWFEAIDHDQRFDVIVSNPPYIAVDDPEVDDGVRAYEPAGALFAGEDGLDAIRIIAAGAPAHLSDGGVLLLEIGYRQGPAVTSILNEAGFSRVEVRRDANGHDRMVVSSLR